MIHKLINKIASSPFAASVSDLFRVTFGRPPPLGSPDFDRSRFLFGEMWGGGILFEIHNVRRSAANIAGMKRNTSDGKLEIRRFEYPEIVVDRTENRPCRKFEILFVTLVYFLQGRIQGGG